MSTAPANGGPALTASPVRDLTVVIPTLNEAAAIARTVRTAVATLPGARVLVVDAGSGDATVGLARAAGAETMTSARGRGVQLAAGARAATTEWLLFLHADTLLPGDAVHAIAGFAQRGPTARVATFRLRFDRAGWFLRACGWFTRFDSVFTRFGDQGIVIRRNFYETLGGFPPWPLFEDVALLQRARRHARIWSLPACVVTSARRFDARGDFGQQWLNARLLFGYLAGTPPEELAARYRTSPHRRERSAAATSAPHEAGRPPR